MLRSCLKIFVLLLTPLVLYGQEDDFFHMSMEELMSVQVGIGSVEYQDVESAHSVVGVLTQKEIRMLGATNLREALEYMTGTATGTSRYHKSIVAIRGDIFAGPNSRVALLVDGIPMREIFQAGGDADVYELFPLEAIKHIEIIRGPGAYLYGANSISGAINIVTKLGHNPHVEAGVDVGSKGFLRERFHGGFHIGDATVAVTAQNQQQDGWRQDYFAPNSGDTLDQYLRAEGTSVLLSAELHKTSLVLYHSNYMNTASLDQNAPEFDLNLKKYYGELRYYFYRRGRDVSVLSLSGAYKENYTEDELFPGGPAILQAHESYGSVNYRNQVSLGLNRLLFGANVLVAEAGTEETNSFVEIQSNSNVTASAFGQYYHQLTRDLNADIGVYITKRDDLDLSVSPRAAVVYNISENDILKAVYNTAYREPSMVESNIVIPTNLVGSRDLNVETAHNIDLQYLFSGTTFNASVSVYFNAVRDIILRKNRDGQADTIVNLGHMNLYGVEAEYRWNAHEHIHLFGSVAYAANAKREGLSDHLAASQVPELILKQALMFEYNELHVGVMALWYGDGQQSDWQTETPFTSPFPEAYVELDAKVSYSFHQLLPSVSAEVYGKVSNILDETIYNTYRVPNSMPAKPGRNFLVGLQLEFK